jgi:hypothetical protein
MGYRQSVIRQMRSATMNPEYQNVYFTSDTDERPTRFAIVTAYNPDGITIGSPQNIIADQKLRNEITGRGGGCFRVTGMSRDATHQEPGWAIDCSEPEGIELGKQFKQEAIFWVSDDRITLINVTTLEKVDLGRFSSLLLNQG